MKETCRAIVLKLIPIYIKFRAGDELKEVVKGSRTSGVSHNVQVLLMDLIYQ